MNIDRSQIETILENDIRPYLKSHGGDIRLTQIYDDSISVCLTGACSGCPSADLDTKKYIESIFKSHNVGISRVEIEDIIPSHMLQLAKKILQHEI